MKAIQKTVAILTLLWGASLSDSIQANPGDVGILSFDHLIDAQDFCTNVSDVTDYCNYDLRYHYKWGWDWVVDYRIREFDEDLLNQEMPFVEQTDALNYCSEISSAVVSCTVASRSGGGESWFIAQVMSDLDDKCRVCSGTTNNVGLPTDPEEDPDPF
ncbi:hypothetical protein [Aliikangiella sp. G2MR2-5]|uniref:hypothetical protein n=1 Tax=Aliikangiella sp. G2MR2-5 TaxID=2788943 RepID=UPI0018AAE2C2|nr:hypothetical protein [Aliikangiella sp. G2MR2-5]